jgi:hypothetical protein
LKTEIKAELSEITDIENVGTVLTAFKEIFQSELKDPNLNISESQTQAILMVDDIAE